MSDSDMEISSDSEGVSRTKGTAQLSCKFRDDCVSADVVAMIPMPPSANPSSSEMATRSAGENPSMTAMPLKKRWRQSLEQEPKKKKVSLEAYRQRRASGGDSGDSLLSTSGTDSASTSAQLKENVKQEQKLARELARQKLSIGELERRKAKLKKALKQIDAAAEASSGPNAAAKNEFDKFTEKQSRWLERRSREKQREVKLERFNSTLEIATPERSSSGHRQKQCDMKMERLNSALDATTRERNSSGHREKRLNSAHDTTTHERSASAHREKRNEVKLGRLNAALDAAKGERSAGGHRQKQRDVKLGRSTSSHDTTTHERSSGSHREKRNADSMLGSEDMRSKRSGQKKCEASPAKRSRADFTSTLQCLQKAKEEVQRQLDLLRSPASSSCGAMNGTNGVKNVVNRLSPRKISVGSPKHSSRK